MALFHCQFFSEVLALSSSMDVILPEVAPSQIGMNNAVQTGSEAPCLLLLHGLSDDHTIWQRRTAIERYAVTVGLAVVMPSVHRSFYADMTGGYRYWTYVSEEVLERARSFFRLSPRRQDNFVAGLSMGGYGAFKLAMHHPDRFAAAASLSGCLDLAARADAPGFPGAHDVKLAFGDPPKIRGTANDLFACAQQLAERSPAERPRLFQCCGTEDVLYSENIRFRDHAAALDLDVTYEDGPGAHEWGYWDRQIQRVIEWLPLQRG